MTAPQSGTCNATNAATAPSGELSSADVGKCYNLTNSCTSTLPLKIFNDDNSNGRAWSGTIYCSDNSSKSITCTAAPCESNACPAGTNGAWLSITSVTGSPKVRSGCY